VRITERKEKKKSPKQTIFEKVENVKAMTHRLRRCRLESGKTRQNLHLESFITKTVTLTKVKIRTTMMREKPPRKTCVKRKKTETRSKKKYRKKKKLKQSSLNNGRRQNGG